MQGLELLIWCCMQEGIQYQPLIRGKSQQEIEELASNMMDEIRKEEDACNIPEEWGDNMSNISIKKILIIFLSELQDSYREIKRWEHIPSLYIDD